MIPAEVLRKKRDGAELTSQEIQFVIRGVVEGSFNQAQAAAFLMAACTRGLSARETGDLTVAMRDSGRRYDFRSLGIPIVDKHSTGGVGDKISLILVSLIAACGVGVPMMSGRGLGHTGGTVDKLESIPGMTMEFDDATLTRFLEHHRCFMIKASADVAPADGILYALRDITGTIESTGLITASILCKKLVEDLDALVLDLKVGRGAFMQTREQANVLAESMLSVAREIGLPMRIVFTNMDHPLGRTVGNWLEIQESEMCLRDIENTPSELRVITEHLASRMLMLANAQLTESEAKQEIRRVWSNGSAHRIFHAMIEAQGGRWEEAERQYSQPQRRVVRAPRSGVLHSFGTRELGLACIELGAGRKRQDDIIDPAAGLRIVRQVGSGLQAGDEVIIIESSNSDRFDVVEQKILSQLHISDEAFLSPKLILDEWSV